MCIVRCLKCLICICYKIIYYRRLYKKYWDIDTDVSKMCNDRIILFS